MPEPDIGIEAFGAFDALPAAARALFGGDAFATPDWYRCVAAEALAPGARACFQLARRGDAVLGVFPMRLDAGGFSALTTPYTVRWSPPLRAGLDAATLAGIGAALGRTWRRFPATRLDAMDGDAAWTAPLLAGAARAGLVALRFAHFGNWHQDVAGLDWARYLAGRPGELRTAIARRARMMDRPGASFTLTRGQDGLEAAIAAYEQVYAASWKEPEPHPGFNPALMRRAAAAGTLRLGVLRLAAAPIAAQFWLLHPGGAGSWAGVQKLAHDEAHRALRPGTVLTALMVRALLEADAVTELDFGRGDDGYKRSWTGARRQRIGVVLAAPWRVGGAGLIARHVAGALARVLARPPPRPSPHEGG
jgi:hypothetical protein